MVLSLMFDDNPDAPSRPCTSLDEPDMMFPDESDERGRRKAKTVCNGTADTPPCPVREQCLSKALESKQQYGVWGGQDEVDRRAILRKGSWAG